MVEGCVRVNVVDQERLCHGELVNLQSMREHYLVEACDGSGHKVGRQMEGMKECKQTPHKQALD